MARAAGLRVYATARTEAKQAVALELGAHEAFASGARLPERVDAVMETVGEATYAHSARSLKPGGRIVISGATSGANPPADLNRFFFLQLELVGSTMGTKDELRDLIAFLHATGLRPRIDRTLPMEQAAVGLAAMASGDLVGKIVLEF
jgi:NADPH:quinone reductase-like Zn-dependent oxidoreductase